MRLIASLFGTLAVALLASFGTASSASAEAQVSKVADVTQVQYYGGGGYNRVCCKRGYRDWWSTYRECRRSGGHVVGNRACRDDRYSHRDRGNHYGEYRDFDRRVCCKRGYRDWWSTYRECRRSGGYVTANRACRWD